MEAVCCIYATATFVQPSDIRTGLSELRKRGSLFVFAGCEFGAPVFRGFTSDGDGIEMLFPDHYATRSQDLPPVFHDAGQFYWGRPASWISKRRIFDRESHVVRVPRWRVHDIDTEEDWKRAELIFSALEAELVNGRRADTGGV